jgi:peptidoglycan/LPS O-acetylase OafA/YrhL
MENPLPKTPEGIVVSTVMLFVFVWQAKSALLLAGFEVNSMVHLWVMLATLVFYLAFVVVALGATEIQSTPQEPETGAESQTTPKTTQ